MFARRGSGVPRERWCGRRSWLRGSLRAALGLAALLALGEARGQERRARGRVASAAMVCPSRDLERFLDAFGESAEVQRAFTRSPLTMLHLDTSASPEPATVEEQVPSERVKFPVFPSAASRARAGFSMKLQARSPDRVDVTLSVADTDHQVVFTFERDACWRLVRVDDQSL